jgi:CheY-like chemotaxis protein
MARIVVVDDNTDLLESRCAAVETDGHETAGAETVDQALALLPADALVADLCLPDVEDGLRLIRETRFRSPGTRIVVCSGLTSYLKGRAEAELVDRVIEKPYRTSRLLVLLRQLVAILFVAGPLGADPVIAAHAPILERRQNAIGTMSDRPLLMFAEKLSDSSGAPYLQYSAIFSNEDGGTSTPALLARWGRTTDIEHVYRVWLNREGRRVRATIQSSGHKDIEFAGPFEGEHPLLRVVTDNNMVGPGGSSAERVALQPVVVDLSGASRERVMDEHPELYRIAAEELASEGKIVGLVRDAREYLYVEAKIANSNTRVAVWVRLGDRWLSSHLGRPEWAIERSGWVRTAIPLGRDRHPEEVGIECLAESGREPGGCLVGPVTRMFLLDDNYRPAPDLWRMDEAVTVGAGEMRSWQSGRK